MVEWVTFSYESLNEPSVIQKRERGINVFDNFVDVIIKVVFYKPNFRLQWENWRLAFESSSAERRRRKIDFWQKC